MSKDASYSDNLRTLWEKRTKRYLAEYTDSLNKLSQTECEILLWDVTRAHEMRGFRTRNHIVENTILDHPERESTITGNTALCLRGKKLFSTARLEKFQVEWQLPHAFVDFVQSHKTLFLATILEYQLSTLKSAEKDTTPPIESIVETLCTASNQLPPLWKTLISFIYTREDQTRLNTWYDTLYDHARMKDTLPPTYPLKEILRTIHSQYPLSIIGSESYDRVHEYLIHMSQPITLSTKLKTALAAMESDHRRELESFYSSDLFKPHVTAYLETITKGLGKIAFLAVNDFIQQHLPNPELQNSSSDPSLFKSSPPIPINTSSSSSSSSSPSSSGTASPKPSRGRLASVGKQLSKIFKRTSSSTSPAPETAPIEPIAQARSSIEESTTTSSDTPELMIGTAPIHSPLTSHHLPVDRPSPHPSSSTHPRLQSSRFKNARQSVIIHKADNDLADSSESSEETPNATPPSSGIRVSPRNNASSASPFL